MANKSRHNTTPDDIMDKHQSVFGGLGANKKKKKKKKHRHSHHSTSPQSTHPKKDEKSSPEPENVAEPARAQGEIRFVLPRSKSPKHSSTKLTPFLFPGQRKQFTLDDKLDENEDRKSWKEKESFTVEESIDDILFAGKKKSTRTEASDIKTSSKKDKRDVENEPHNRADLNGFADGAKKKSKQSEQHSNRKESDNYADESPRKINARSVEDAVQDKIGRRPRANSTDGELNLPSRGLCDEHIILESHKWDLLRLHNNNSLAIQRPPPPRGMVNLGNTCFLNATLQCLLYMPSFCQSITSLPASCYESNDGGKHVRGQRITMMLRNLSRMAHGILAMEKNESPKTKAIAPKAILNAITSYKTGGHRFRLGRQEDAHELLVHLLDAMHEGELFAAGINPHASGWRDRLPIARLDETTFVHRIFGGYFRSQLRCQCGYKSNTYDPFLDLALEVSKKHIHSLETAFGEFTRKEKLDSENRWKCSGCKKHVCPTKHLSVFRPPLSLCIHLKRFDYFGAGYGKGGWGGGGYGHRHGKGLGMMGGGGSKITKEIQFPAHLSLPLSDGRVCEYGLTGIIVHVGNSATSGHYTAYVKKPGDSKCWYHMDDSFVEAVSEKAVLKQRDAYVLFYSRKEVKLEFPQPPREPVLKNGMKQKATKVGVETSPSNEPASRKMKDVKVKESTPAQKNFIKPGNTPSTGQPTLISESTPASLSASLSSTPKDKSTTSPLSDSSAIKRAHEANSNASSSSDSSESGSDSSASEKNNLVDVKRSLEFVARGQTPPSSTKPNTSSASAKKMLGNNVEVVLSLNKKRSWKPPEATKVNSGEGNVLLGNIAVGNWNDEDDVKLSKGNAKDSKDKSSLRDLASKAMESADRSRKRDMYLDRWDAAIDEGKRKKVKAKKPETEEIMKVSSDSFQRIQRDMQLMNKGRPKGFRSTKDPPGRVLSFKKMKRKSMQRS